MECNKCNEETQIRKLFIPNYLLGSILKCISNSLNKIKLKEEPIKKDYIYDENENIIGGTIDGRKLNYAEKMVLNAMTAKQNLKLRR